LPLAGAAHEPVDRRPPGLRRCLEPP
jgi:hypothetical protein